MQLLHVEEVLGYLVEGVLPVLVAEGVALYAPVHEELVEVEVDAVAEEGEASPQGDGVLGVGDAEVLRPVAHEAEVEVVAVEGEDDRVLVKYLEGLADHFALVGVDLDLCAEADGGLHIVARVV